MGGTSGGETSLEKPERNYGPGGPTRSGERSISRPNYGANTGYTPEHNPSQSEIDFNRNENTRQADNANDNYRHENPILALADDASKSAQTLIKLAIGLSIGYLGVEAYKAYKTK